MDWQQATERADRLVESAAGYFPADNWDGRAVRGVLAVVLAGLARRQHGTVADVGIDTLLWHLERGPACVYELGDDLGLGEVGVQPEAAVEKWAWLTRRWPAAPPSANGDGLARGIGRGSQLPAVDVCTQWAAAVVRDTRRK